MALWCGWRRSICKAVACARRKRGGRGRWSAGGLEIRGRGRWTCRYGNVCGRVELANLVAIPGAVHARRAANSLHVGMDTKFLYRWRSTRLIAMQWAMNDKATRRGAGARCVPALRCRAVSCPTTTGDTLLGHSRRIRNKMDVTYKPLHNGWLPPKTPYIHHAVPSPSKRSRRSSCARALSRPTWDSSSSTHSSTSSSSWAKNKADG